MLDIDLPIAMLKRALRNNGNEKANKTNTLGSKVTYEVRVHEAGCQINLPYYK